jgi:hypothetical protein
VLNPDIHGTELVFQAWDGTDYEIFRYRFDTGEIEQITNNQFDDTHPVVWNGEIAWIAHPTVNAEIFHYRDGVIRKISEPPTTTPPLPSGKAASSGTATTTPTWKSITSTGAAPSSSPATRGTTSPPTSATASSPG